MEWTGAATDNVVSVGVGATSPFYVVLPSQARALTNPTLIRSIGHVELAQSGSIIASGAWGLITWDDPDDSTPGGVDVPNPYTRPDLAWIAHGYIFMMGGSSTAVQSPANESPTFDVRSMRKLPQPRGVLFVVANGAGAGILLYKAGVRCLLKE